MVVNCFIFLFDSWMVLLYNRDFMKTTLLTTAVFLGFFVLSLFHRFKTWNSFRKREGWMLPLYYKEKRKVRISNAGDRKLMCSLRSLQVWSSRVSFFHWGLLLRAEHWTSSSSGLSARPRWMSRCVFLLLSCGSCNPTVQDCCMLSAPMVGMT